MKKITFLFFLLSITLGFAQEKIGLQDLPADLKLFGNAVTQTNLRVPCGYNQPENGTPNATNFGSPQPTWFPADDFDVADDVFTPQTFTIAALVSIGQTMVNSDVIIYTDNGGSPGPILNTFSALVPVSQNIVGSAFGLDIRECVFDLTASPVNLSGTSSGTKYWIGVKGISSDGSEMYWNVTPTVTGSEAYFTFDSGNLWEPVGPLLGLGPVDNVFTLDGNCNNLPIIACPSDIIQGTDPGVCGAVVNFANAIAIDPDGGPVTVVQTMGPTSGSVFPVGDTTVEFTATDQEGGSSTCQFTVTVVDDEPPTITCPDNIVVDNDPGVCGAIVDYPDPMVVDNCFMGGSTTTGSLTTLFATNNNGSLGGAVYFDVTVGPSDIEVTDFEINTAEAGAITMNVYTLVGTYVGNTANPAAWGAPAATGTGTGAGQNNPSTVTLGSSITLTANTTYGIALTLDAAHGHRYTNGTGCPGNQCASNADLSIALGATSNVPFTAPTFSPRVFNGSILYEITTAAVPYTVVSGLPSGSLFPVGTTTNTLEYTDGGGNSAQCSFDVTVNDTEAPEIVCIGQPATVTENETTSPGVPIPDNDPNGIATTLTVTDDFEITDLDVNLDITHTWVGDLIVTLESPSGTSVVIYDRPGVPTTTFGCSGDNILATLDDEAATLVEDECGAGVPSISGSFIPNNALSAFDGQSTLGDWILTVSDNGGGDTGTLNSWGITYTHDVSATPLDVILDANGMATINASDLILSATDNCGNVTISTVGQPPVMESLSTTFVGGNGNFGNMFDVNALTDITMDSFDINADTGATFDVEVYAKSGTWVGFEEDPSAWTLIGTATGIVSNGDGVATPLNLSLNYTMAAGETHAFYVTPTDFSTGGLNYTNGTATGNVFASDANIEFLEGAAKGYPFTGLTFEPRVFNGNIHYSVGTAPSATIDFDCSNLGESTVDIMATDDSGNSSVCTATVNVIDNTAPIITCGPEPIITETVSDSPGLAIPDNDPTGVSTTISVTDDVTLSDLNVDLDITHTWVGDLIVTITSPAGTSATIVDRIGGTGGGVGCSGDDILATLDDAATSPIEDECGAGVPSIDGTFSPNNPLSVFNGESTLGDWTITISDNAGGDLGTLNTWGLTYSYANTNTDVVIELGPDGTATIDPYDIISDVVEACGIATAAVDITEVSCADIGTPLTVTAFVSDTSGNIASCSATVIVVDNLAPEITCPADQTVDPGAGNLFYILPDYFGTGEATAVDNCTDPVTITTQDPAAGTPLSDGTYTITLTAEDEYGNVSTCSFELTVETILGVNSNNLDTGVTMYPNPASNVVNLLNKTNISLEQMVIFDINGKRINQIDLRGMQGEKAIDVSSLSAGVYVVQIVGDQASTVKRLIKE